MTTNLYKAKGFNAPDGDAKIETLKATIAFDGSQGMGDGSVDTLVGKGLS